jgi:hypothetical protein
MFEEVATEFFLYPFIICNLYKYIQQISVRVRWVEIDWAVQRNTACSNVGS